MSKTLEKNDKTMVKKKHSPFLGGPGGGGGFQVSWTKSIHFFFFFFYFPNAVQIEVFFTHAPCSSMGLQMDIFSPSPSPHHQLFVSFRYRKRHVGECVLRCDAIFLK